MKLSPGYKPAATVLGAMILLGGVAAPAMAVPHPVASVCGGQVPDYVGLLGDDAPFEGKVALPGGGTADLSSTPLSADGRVRVEIERNPDDSRYAISRLNIYADSSGSGLIDFKTFAGEGWSSEVNCAPVLGAPSTRVTQITGTVEICASVGEVVEVRRPPGLGHPRHRADRAPRHRPHPHRFHRPRTRRLPHRSTHHPRHPRRPLPDRRCPRPVPPPPHRRRPTSSPPSHPDRSASSPT